LGAKPATPVPAKIYLDDNGNPIPAGFVPDGPESHTYVVSHPTYRVTLPDGRKFDVITDGRPPSEADVLGALQTNAARAPSGDVPAGFVADPDLGNVRLAQLVRARYPGAYDDLDDDTLEQKVIEKYPQYANLAKSKNVTAAKMVADQIRKAATDLPRDTIRRVGRPIVRAVRFCLGYGLGSARICCRQERGARIAAMRTIAIANQKGGSCKTTMAVNLAAAFAERRHCVCLVDLTGIDPATS
jgi:hypothetical protein